MFPSTLDNANVLYYTPAGNYGAVYWSHGGIADYITFLAICKYPDSEECCLFSCNEQYEVVADDLFSSVQEAMNAVRQEITWLKA